MFSSLNSKDSLSASFLKPSFKKSMLLVIDLIDFSISFNASKVSDVLYLKQKNGPFVIFSVVIVDEVVFFLGT